MADEKSTVRGSLRTVGCESGEQTGGKATGKATGGKATRASVSVEEGGRSSARHGTEGKGGVVAEAEV